jgi:hypothetical protein
MRTARTRTTTSARHAAEKGRWGGARSAWSTLNHLH